ncbi:MAG TPA: hypothetical protein VE422_27990 [Terriglobia bacterium]|nr:hypothetical protein [Terriglobia bacterium]
MSLDPLSEEALYKELYEHLRGTDDVSFKLLGIVPLISGTGIIALFWGKDAVPTPVVWLLSLFAASVTVALYRWELHNIGVCWWLAKRIGAIEKRWAKRVDADVLMASTLSELRPPSGIDKPHAESIVYGGTTLVWLAVPWLYSFPPLVLWSATSVYVAVSAVIGLCALFSVVQSLITHHWPNKRGTTPNTAMQPPIGAPPFHRNEK